jgi:hypothetical protein
MYAPALSFVGFRVKHFRRIKKAATLAVASLVLFDTVKQVKFATSVIWPLAIIVRISYGTGKIMLNYILTTLCLLVSYHSPVAVCRLHIRSLIF